MSKSGKIVHLRTLLSGHIDIAEEISPNPELSDILSYSKENLVFVIYLSRIDTENSNIVDFVSRLIEIDEKISYYFSSFDDKRLNYFNSSSHDFINFFHKGKLSNIITFENMSLYVRRKVESEFIKKVKRKIAKNDKRVLNKKSRKNLIESLRIKGGCVYVLESPSAPNILKIGYTNQKLNTRITQIKNGTGVLPDLDCVAVYETEYASLLESDIHMKFNNNRIGGNREFFNVPLSSVSSYIENRNCANMYLYNNDIKSFEFFPIIDNSVKVHKNNQVRKENYISINGLKVLNIENINMINSKDNNKIAHEDFKKPEIELIPGNQTTATPAFGRGSHQDDVLRLQGTPTNIASYDTLGFEEWRYGRSMVKIDTRTRQVLEWRNNGDLKIDFLPGNQTTATPAFGRGSHQDDVLRLQGTPTNIASYDTLGFEEWRYGHSMVKIDTRTRQVLEWRNNGDLKCN